MIRRPPRSTRTDTLFPYTTLFRSEGKTLDEMYEATRGKGFGAEVQRRVLIGTYVLSAGYYDPYYNTPRRMRSPIAPDFTHTYETVYALLTSTAPSAALAMRDKKEYPPAQYLNDLIPEQRRHSAQPGTPPP